MTEKRNLQLYIADVLEAIVDVRNFVKDIASPEELKSDRKTWRAVIQAYEVIGEAMRKLGDAVRDKHPEIEWRKIIAMRNLLTHEYWGVDAAEVWKSIKSDLPQLEENVLSIQKEMGA